MKEFSRYLKILGIENYEKSLNALAAICRAHLNRIPFENISKLYRFRTNDIITIPTLSEYLDGIENSGFGGTCYSNNFYLNGLLNFLEFDVTLCAANMNRPHTHMVNLVKLGGKEYIVDVGYAAPFLSPLPRDLDRPFKIKLGNDSYILEPKAPDGSSQIKLIRKGKLHHGYRIFPQPRRLEDFRTVIENSFRPDAVFMNSLLLVKFDDNGSTIIHNYAVIRTKGQKVRKHELKSSDELIRTIQDHFGIKPEISFVALDGVSFSKDPWS